MILGLDLTPKKMHALRLSPLFSHSAWCQASEERCMVPESALFLIWNQASWQTAEHRLLLAFCSESHLQGQGPIWAACVGIGWAQGRAVAERGSLARGRADRRLRGRVQRALALLGRFWGRLPVPAAIMLEAALPATCRWVRSVKAHPVKRALTSRTSIYTLPTRIFYRASSEGSYSAI